MLIMPVVKMPLTGCLREENRMLQIANIIGTVMCDIYPEAMNEYEALDIYIANLHKKIRLKSNANIDCKNDIALLLSLTAFSKPIADIVAGRETEAK